MSTSFDEWMRKGKYLPDFMRDFHDQKRIFKRIDEIRVNDTKHQSIEIPNWIQAHVYVIDFFLWFMGRRGYTLQRCRAEQPFISLHQDLREFDEREMERFRLDLEEMRKERDGATDEKGAK